MKLKDVPDSQITYEALTNPGFYLSNQELFDNYIDTIHSKFNMGDRDEEVFVYKYQYPDVRGHSFMFGVVVNLLATKISGMFHADIVEDELIYFERKQDGELYQKEYLDKWWKE